MDTKVPALREALVVELQPVEGDSDGLASLRVLAAQLPAPEELAPGRLVAVPDQPIQKKKASLLQRLVRRPEPRVARAARCTALLARGYVRISAGCDEEGIDWAWGYVSS